MVETVETRQPKLSNALFSQASTEKTLARQIMPSAVMGEAAEATSSKHDVTGHLAGVHRFHHAKCTFD